MNVTLKSLKVGNKGSGLGVILYGMTLLLILIFTAINIVNSKVIENGYSSLRDAVQAASSGSVIHLLTSEREGTTSAQKTVIQGRDDKGQPTYDIYLQLALGYLINRSVSEESNDDTITQTGEINNFIKLDHQKVVNSTLSLLDNAVIRDKSDPENVISNTKKYKIMMFFIEPYRNSDGKRYFNIIAYGNGDYKNGNIQKEIFLEPAAIVGTDMQQTYKNVQDAINRIVNTENDTLEAYRTKGLFDINLNATGDLNQLIRDMETYPHYVIVVKDFALPTIFDGVETGDIGSGIKSLFNMSGDGTLATPMCALNTGKIQRQVEEAGWSKDR